jgi:ribonuclease P protein component
VLPANHRLRRRSDFAATTRAPLRAGAKLVVVHLLLAVPADATEPVRVGFVVSKAVGGSVARHRVVRRLRAVTAPLLAELPAGSRVVIRALAPAATASSAELAADLRGALDRVLSKAGRMAQSKPPIVGGVASDDS